MADNREPGNKIGRVALASATHVPVMLEEAVQALAVQPGGRYIDATLGAGGHAAAILESSAPGGQLLGIDADPGAVKVAQERLKVFGGSVLTVNDNFANLQAICFKHDFSPVHGILFDLGLSLLQLESDRGFSFQHDAPLGSKVAPFGPQAAVFLRQVLQAQGLSTGKVIQKRLR